MHSAELRLGIRRKIPKHNIANMFFSISLTSLPLEMTKPSTLFKFIQNDLSCKRGKGPISLVKVLYFIGVSFLEDQQEFERNPLWNRWRGLMHALNRGFCYNKEIVETEALR